jgi:hypothetical protein
MLPFGGFGIFVFLRWVVRSVDQPNNRAELEDLRRQLAAQYRLNPVDLKI